MESESECRIVCVDLCVCICVCVRVAGGPSPRLSVCVQVVLSTVFNSGHDHTEQPLLTDPTDSYGFHN